MERSSGAAPPRQLLTVGVERANGDISIISLSGELDLATIPALEAKLFEEVGSRTAVIVDLTRLTFIDSSGIGLLIKAYRAKEDSARAELHTVIAGRSQVERVFRLAGIDRALPVHLDLSDALALLGDRGS